MKCIIQFGFIIILLHSCGTQSPKDKCTHQAIPELESQLRVTYNKEPDKALVQMQQLVHLYECSNAEHHKVGNTYLNMGTLYNEEKKELDSAIIFLTKADSVFQATNDSMGRANILKYQGMVEVINGNNNGIAKIELSKNLFESLNFRQGKMVAQQNEAKARLHLKELAQADSLLIPCLDFWNGKHIRWQYVFYDLMEVHEQMKNCDLWQNRKEKIFSFSEMLSVENEDKLKALDSLICN